MGVAAKIFRGERGTAPGLRYGSCSRHCPGALWQMVVLLYQEPPALAAAQRCESCLSNTQRRALWTHGEDLQGRKKNKALSQPENHAMYQEWQATWMTLLSKRYMTGTKISRGRVKELHLCRSV